jgi:hypothetical protein
MTDRRSDIIKKLEKSLEDSIALYKSLQPGELSAMVYQGDASWTVKQVLAHFITIERSMQWLFKKYAFRWFWFTKGF